MVHRLKEPFGKAGLIVAIVALVAALTGAAYAVGGLTKKQEKQVVKIAKKYAGKNGKDGAPGSNGSNGAPGSKGDQGIQGVAGKNGEDGEDGSPWTAGGVLPAGSTETGSWSFGSTSEASVTVQIPFAIPLSAPLAGRKFSNTVDTGNVHFINAAGEEVLLNETTFAEVKVAPTDCPGDAEEPEAEPGHLCIYTGNAEGAWGIVSNFIGKAGAPKVTNPPFPPLPEGGASTAGAVLPIDASAVGAAEGFGTYAVTG